MTDSERIEKLFSDREKSAQQARASANRKRLLMAGLGTLGIIGATGLVMYLGAKEQYGILLGIFPAFPVFSSVSVLVGNAEIPTFHRMVSDEARQV